MRYSDEFDDLFPESDVAPEPAPMATFTVIDEVAAVGWEKLREELDRYTYHNFFFTRPTNFDWLHIVTQFNDIMNAGLKEDADADIGQ